MSQIRLIHATAMLMLLTAVLPCSVGAQEGETFVRISPSEGQCHTDAFTVGYIGYKDLECNCSFTIGPDGPQRYEFRAEPVIGGVEAGSPADGKLRAGDVIAAIDGHLITTREGGRRFARLMPGEPVTLTVRRRDRELDVTVVPDPACYEVASLPPPRAPSLPERVSDTPAPPRRPSATPTPPSPAPDTPSPPRRPTVVEAPRAHPADPTPPPPPPTDLSNGWVGLSIRCNDCRVGDSDGVPVWEFSSAPEVDRVESGSPAHGAGIQAGDILTHINGQLMTSARGGRLFGAVEPGDTVTFRYTRNNTVLEARIVAEERLRLGRSLSVARRDPASPLPPPVTRFSGVVGDTQVLVTGGPVSVNRTDDEVVIQAGDVTVRIRRTGSPPQ